MEKVNHDLYDISIHVIFFINQVFFREYVDTK